MTINYGPLNKLIGTYVGDNGMDVSPESNDSEHSPYYETIIFTEAGNLENALEQQLVALHYHQIVQRKSDDSVFHNQTGYWIWDEDSDEITQTISIPRAVCLLAKGKATSQMNDVIEIKLQCDINDQYGGIIQSEFMHTNAKTKSFDLKLTISDNKIQYKQTSHLDIYDNNFEHTDENTLFKQ